MITPDRNASSTPLDPSRRSLLRAMVAIPATALVLGELPGLLGSAAAAAPAHGSATRYTIVPFLNSDDGTVNVYQSDDATDFRLVKSSAYTPPSNRIRDASVFKHTDGYYYLTYTTHTWQDVSTTIGFARSSDRANWTFLYDYTVPLTSLSRAWAPEWFVDSDGSVNVIVSCSTTDNEWIFTPYVMKAANSALTAWSSPVALSGIGANHIDTFIVKIGSTYHAFPKNETTKYIEYATASSLTGPYTITRTGDWAGWGGTREGPSVIQLDNGAWRIFFDGYGDGSYYYSDSYDTFATWTAPKKLPGISGTARHFTVIKETVSGGVDLPTGVTRSFRSGNYATRYWQEQSALLNLPVVSSSSTTAEKQASTFTVLPGLADANAYSFRDAAGNYLRHWDFRGRFDANDGTSTFAKDATFVIRTGTPDGAVRFESYNYPGYYLRHYNYQLRVDVSDGTDLFRQDSSFVPVTAWA
ncbi:arabinofuranosidase [Streptomyces sp. S1A1-8]|uniref:glycoside hydrolase family 43 protein n=1 Tax=Streptomyces TaxID=1883 RepID=UPI001165C4C7|nr:MULTISPECIES: glycoside hydrolase family 43 protein [unclassified Streptomyces]QDN82080.1 arabinofuranosidase [Streptomyces sp. S1A1-7]QDO02480.1 arabinofuranosidase [Streptomyces sp. RLB1-9]QDO24215.1 arabinofuranosidase [Streptomyces sp. S1A1-8]QDO34337.1 arabinofuranosidase [Streptomyces sp. S1A1-3]